MAKQRRVSKSKGTQSESEQRFVRRRQQLLRKLEGQAALFVAAEPKNKSRDASYPYHADRDFLYLTGFSEPHAALLLLGNARGPRSILFVKDRDPRHEVWEGERLGVRRARRRFKVDEVRGIETFEAALPELLTHSSTLHYSAGTNTSVDALVWKHYRSAVGPRMNFPRVISDARLLTSQMRVVKDRDEIRMLKHVAEITAKAFCDFLPMLRTVKSERHGAALLEGLFARYGADDLAFPTILASGKNGTTLHHTPLLTPVWQRELVLIDAGASYRGYAADITRTVAPSGTFSAVQGQVYDVVHHALERAKERCKPHSTLDDIHQAAARAITSGLVELKVLRGNVQQLTAQKAYQPYFMHRTSHWLGLDTHDISPIYMDEYLIPSGFRPLEPGNVFTLEPGLYFPIDDPKIPARLRGIGIRIEDDILITKDGHEVLTKGVPSAREELEALMK